MKKMKKLPPLADAQLEVMQLVWRHGEVTVSDVWQALSQQKSVARNTVLTVMDRLAKRGWLRKRRVGSADLYEATCSEQAAQGTIVGRLIDKAFYGSADSLVLALLQERGVSEEEAERIQRMLKESRKGDN